jgi:hypothetical protein
VLTRTEVPRCPVFYPTRPVDKETTSQPKTSSHYQLSPSCQVQPSFSYRISCTHTSSQQTMDDQLVLPSTPADGVRVLALNRPSKRNALSQELITVFLEHLKAASRDNGVRVIVITGSSTFFCGMNSLHLLPIPYSLFPHGQGYIEPPRHLNRPADNTNQQPELISGRSHASMRKLRGTAATCRIFARGCKPCASL